VTYSRYLEGVYLISLPRECMRCSSSSIARPRRRNRSEGIRSHSRNERGAVHSLATHAQRIDWRILAFCLGLTVATLSVYARLASHPFLNYDDPQYVSENPHIQAGLSVRTLNWALTAVYASNWHPLSWISHAIDYQLYGLEPGGHHISSLVIHVVNVVLLFWLLQRMTGAIGRSAFVAGLFALHPLNVESVAWIAERKSVLSTLFFLLTLIAYLMYVRQTNWKRYLVVILFFIMGLASKPMVISLPFILLLLDYWPLCRIQRSTPPSDVFPLAQASPMHLVQEKWPLFLLSVASALITLFAQRAGNSVEPLGYLPIGWRIENALCSYTAYLCKIFWPLKLAVFYPHPLNTWTLTQVGLSTLFLLVVSGAVWSQRAKCGYALAGWLWFVGTLVPVIGIVQVGAQGMADRYTYIPAIGIFVIVSWGGAEIVRRLRLDSWHASAIALLVIGAASAGTIRQLGYWKSPYDLWKHTLDITQNNYVADDGMGYVLLHQGRREALRYYEAAASITPWDPISHNAIAGNLQDSGKLIEAIHEYNIALNAKPESKLLAHIYAELGFIYRELGDDAQAQQNSALSLRTDPEELPNMISQLSQRLAEHPAALGYFRLGSLLEAANRLPEAKAAYEKALEINSTFNSAQIALEDLRTKQY
jgi:protein O-mannosyl-transferase